MLTEPNPADASNTFFTSADTNKDGKLSQSEFMSACATGGVISRGMTGTGTTKPATPSKYLRLLGALLRTLQGLLHHSGPLRGSLLTGAGIKRRSYSRNF